MVAHVYKTPLVQSVMPCKAYENRHVDFFSKLDITSLEDPVLEERKRTPRISRILPVDFVCPL